VTDTVSDGSRLTLPTDAVDLWHLHLTALQADAECLSADELARAQRFRLEEKRIQFLSGRSQLRRILARYLDREAGDLRFTYGEHGKPAIPDAADLQFNLSHSHEAGLVAVLRGVRVGVDVELARPGRRFTGLAGKFFSAAENQALLGLAEAKQRQAFYRAWVRKEAYLKAWGTGLSFPSNRFTLSFLAGEPSRLIDSEMPGDDPAAQVWQFHGVPTFPGFAAAVCYPGSRRWLRQYMPTAAGVPTPGPHCPKDD